MITPEKIIEAHYIQHQERLAEFCPELFGMRFLIPTAAKWPWKEGQLRCIEEKKVWLR